MNTIDSHTKISKILQENKAAIEAIASLAKPLEKLRNPLMRKIMASRVTIAEAAKMGGCTIDDFKKALQPLGFVFEESTTDALANNSAVEKPQWLIHTPIEQIHFFDVRPMLQSGNDPLKEIMQRLKGMAPQSILCIINSFIPVPLIRLLEKDQALSFTETISDTEYRTYFLKVDKQKDVAVAQQDFVIMEDTDSFQQIINKYTAHRIVTIDVRSIPMPGPMEAILSQLEQLKNDEILLVHHKRIPVYLLESLADQSWIVHIHSISDTEVNMLIHKK
ncbi:MAG: DUF2249 domain-containing protein [Hydrotalea flava]|uniref:DUF2249 domain-containing protein n=1 Tax=Hydrotalea TaxID=1004300 RepID=UPI000945A967|nr:MULTISPECIES: DUF2249 domain-containing protein [Hydrotalea]NIM36674.1 DUF2249 domain-containing protein [Hydrotalea flava]NIM39534.1 DUF2249 domain-containing protein [Hydrotalea flava]NIN04723.1 DUF2249 domain-containing protein [Hydrotalea flava]NIN16395.1 DUF2249 domain-containing protein [Hydrotalea flava]NIO95460.1 DUF2249 domain-containing protein [Hydrotalea flava]